MRRASRSPRPKWPPLTYTATPSIRNGTTPSNHGHKPDPLIPARALSAKDDADETAKAWDGMRNIRSGAGTIFHIARQNGWKPEPRKVLAAPVATCEPTYPDNAVPLDEARA